MNRYIIGIDLGTTNSAVSYVDLLAGDTPIKNIGIFKVPQLTGPGEISYLNILPSFFYIPGVHEFNKDALELAWPSEEKGFVGAFAREQGGKTPQRLVSSAKSWLCHGKVDRKAPILPWGAEKDLPVISPVDVTSSYLRHIKNAWNHSMKGNESFYLENQTVIITVPASFDEVARDLTIESANLAGIKEIILLEEPISAFYNWLIIHEKEWDRIVRPGDLILVCDVGGGTTDFTLITLREIQGNPVFDRIAVGDHLILGGDNMDIALAHRSEMRLKRSEKGRLNIHRWQSLCHQCRQAKESILSDQIASKVITLIGEGRKLIADTVSTSIDRREVEETILEGFFPVIDHSDALEKKTRPGMTEFGLPYAQDPAITRHLIRFLEQHKDDVFQILGRPNPEPDMILFNGGALKPAVIQDRIRSVIRHWFHEKDRSIPRVLVNPELDLAVALGASYYGLVKKGHGVKVGSGSARAYYLGVGRQEEGGETEPDSPEIAVCLVERGMEEGSAVELKDKKLHVLANQPVSFDLYSSSFRTGDRTGDLIIVDDTLTSLPPVHTVIQFGKKAVKTTVPVKMEASYTETGSLSIWCKSIRSSHKWRLQFQLRNTDHSPQVSDQEVFEESLVDEALCRIKETFSGRSGDITPVRLVKAISEIVKRPREKWPLNFIRRMADQLSLYDITRKLSLDHEIRWLNLIGFCMRPGFGDALDEHRIQKLWKIYQGGPVHAKNVQARSEWWILWRRVAGGLSTAQQRHILAQVSPLINLQKKAAKKKLAPQEQMEIWMALGNMEYLPQTEKITMGKRLVQDLSPKKSKPQYWWSLSRIGAREPLYGNIELVVPAHEVTNWIETILKKQWRNPKPVGLALSQMARLTGDRKRDLEPDVVQEVIKWLTPFEWSIPHIKILRELIPIDQQEKSDIFGESIPTGILLCTQ